MKAPVAAFSLKSLLAPESEPSADSFGHPAAWPSQTSQKAPWRFILGYILCLSVLGLVLGLWWQSATNLPTVRHQPQLLDAELAMIYRAEHAQTDAYAHAPQSGEFASGRQSEVQWVAIAQQFYYAVQKVVLVKQLQRLARLQQSSMHKLKHSGLV